MIFFATTMPKEIAWDSNLFIPCKALVTPRIATNGLGSHIFSKALEKQLKTLVQNLVSFGHDQFHVPLYIGYDSSPRPGTKE